MVGSERLVGTVAKLGVEEISFHHEEGGIEPRGVSTRPSFPNEKGLTHPRCWRTLIA